MAQQVDAEVWLPLLCCRGAIHGGTASIAKADMLHHPYTMLQTRHLLCRGLARGLEVLILLLVRELCCSQLHHPLMRIVLIQRDWR